MDAAVDLLVIGGGINGAGVARDAAGRGLSVILCEKDDLAEGTSSRSGKYIHGGLRYLEYAEFRLVREALIEREVILAAAPHLSWPLRLVLVHSAAQRPRWLIRLGLFFYDHLGGRKRIPSTRAVNLTQDPEGESLRDAYTRAFAYWDVWVDDARLVIVNAMDAARRGADVMTRTACISARREGDIWHARLRGTETGEIREVTARAIFNAAGPWVETVLGNVSGVNAERRVRLVKGSHIILQRWWKGNHGYVLQAPDKRLIFVNPYFDDLALVGTTDIPFEDAPERVAISSDETTYLLDILNGYFNTQLTEHDVLHGYSGVRPLFDDDAEKGASAVTRDYEFEFNGGAGRAPIVSAFGGKITTYRKLAEHGLERLREHFPEMGPAWTADAPLPGAGAGGDAFGDWRKSFENQHSGLGEELLRHYVRCYGTDAEMLLGSARAPSDLGRHFGGLLYEREVRWLMTHEWAETADDILSRRTKHGLFLSADERDALDHWLSGGMQD